MKLIVQPIRLPEANRFGRYLPAIALTAAAAILLAGLGMAMYGERTYRAQKRNELDVQARILASTVTAALAFNDRNAAQEYVGALAANPEIEIAAIYDAAGNRFAAYSGPDAREASLRAPLGPQAHETGRQHVSVAVLDHGAMVGSIYLQTAPEPPARLLQRYGATALLVTMVALVVAILGAAQAALTRANRALAEANAALEDRADDLAYANQRLQTQIAERERVEEALRQAQKMEAIGQLTGGVAHDFNNLLQVVLGNLHAVQQQLAGGAPNPSVTVRMRRQIDMAILGGERAATLTQRLLAFARRQPLAPKPVETNRLVQEMSDLLHRTLGESVRLETRLSGAPAWISVDANQLESALLNLAVNARDAMPGGGTLWIQIAMLTLDTATPSGIETLPAGSYVALTVADTGTGMSPEVMRKAFDPFFTTKDVGQGTGLGLSQVYGFVKQSGGHVQIRSTVGQGTEIQLLLPRLAEPPASADALEVVEQMPLASGGELVLVVEDEEDVRELTVEMLQQLGYSVVEAGHGAEALAMLARHGNIRLLFTDVGLPGGMDGVHLAEAARRMRPELRVLLTTGYARDGIAPGGRADETIDLIRKPFRIAGLAKHVREVLDRE